jgi:hypothetical protein
MFEFPVTLSDEALTLIADRIADRVALNTHPLPDAKAIAEEISMGDLASEFSTSDIAECIADDISASDVAEHISAYDVAQEMSVSDIASEIDVSAIAAEIDIRDLAFAVVNELIKRIPVTIKS